MVLTIALFAVSIVFIILAVIAYTKKNPQGKETTYQRVLAFYQIVLCGAFFALSLSDALDAMQNISKGSYNIVILDIFYDVAFLAMAVYVFFNLKKPHDKYFLGVMWAVIALIAVQCFVFPYSADSEFVRVFEAVEGIMVYSFLIVITLNIRKDSLANRLFPVIVLLELIVAIEKTVMPMATIIGDPEAMDIPLNYAALYMRPVLLASLGLAHKAWLDRHLKA